MSFDKGMSCEDVYEKCRTNKAFAAACRDDLFWLWQCQLRKYDREDRLFPNTTAEQYWTPVPAPGTKRVPFMGSWQNHYIWWCLRAHDNDSLRYSVGGLPGIYYAPTYPGIPRDDVDRGPIASWDVSQVTDMSSLFAKAEYFEGDLSMWDVSRVKDMSDMFKRARRFNSDISGWDVSNVGNMSGMFDDAERFNGDISEWNVKNVKNMAEMFAGALSFNRDLSDWDIDNVDRMDRMFAGARMFTSDLSEWEIYATNVSYMFRGAISFNSDLSKWFDPTLRFLVVPPTQMQGMFQDARQFNSDLDGWDVSKVESMNEMFRRAYSFNGNIQNWDVSGVLSMRGMFAGATSFNGDLQTWNISRLSLADAMFKDAESFNCGRAPGEPHARMAGWDIRALRSVDNMFLNTPAFAGRLPQELQNAPAAMVGVGT